MRQRGPMRVLMLAQFFDPILGGEERAVELLARGLLDRGHEVSVATTRVDGLPDEEVRDGLRIHRLATLSGRIGPLYTERGRRHVPPVADPEALLGLRRVLARERPDVVHAHNWLVHSFVPLKRRSSAALVMSLHDYSLVCATKRLMRNGLVPCAGPGPVRCLTCSSRVYGSLKGAPTAVLNWGSSRAELRAVDLFLPVSAAVADRCGLADGSRPFRVVPNLFRPGEDGAGPRPDWLPEGDFVLCVGDLTADKGVDVLLEAHARLASRPPLVLIGRPYSPELARPRPDVHVVGPRPHEDVSRAWAACAVAAVPSTWAEPFGLVALEAMAAGKPVVASRVGGLAGIVGDGESGLLVPPADADALRVALERLLADAHLRARLGAGGRRRVEDFAPEVIVPLVEEAYAVAGLR